MEDFEPKKRKRQKKKDLDDDEMDIEDENELTMEPKEIHEEVNVEFIFSNIVEENFQSIRSLLQPLFAFEDINPSDLFDLLIFQHEDVGTTIKSENEVFGVFSYIPLTYYKNLPNHNKFVDKFYLYLRTKIESHLKDDEKKKIALDIIGNDCNNLGMLINERAVNMPQETIPPALGLITKEIRECREIDGYDKRYEFDYLVIVSRFVKILDKNTKGKKPILGIEYKDDKAFYKFETPHFINQSVVSFDYKIPYKEKNMEYLENQNEPKYMNILIIKAKDYFTILKNKFNCEIEL